MPPQISGPALIPFTVQMQTLVLEVRACRHCSTGHTYYLPTDCVALFRAGTALWHMTAVAGICTCMQSLSYLQEAFCIITAKRYLTYSESLAGLRLSRTDRAEHIGLRTLCLALGPKYTPNAYVCAQAITALIASNIGLYFMRISQVLIYCNPALGVQPSTC